MTVIRIIVLILWMHSETIPGLTDIPSPCPVSMNSPGADMCMPSIAIEKNGNGYEYLDSVVLRAMVGRGGCICDIFIDNYIAKTNIFIEKYENMSAAAPEYNLCGLAIDIEMLNDESVSNTIECTNGLDRRLFSIVKNGILRFTSRVIPGNFTRGYCIHIIRDTTTNSIPQRLKIVCNESDVLQHESSSINPTETKPVTHDDNTLFIAIGIVVAVLVMTTIVIIYIISTRRRRSNKRLEELQRNNVPDTNAKK
ncbi:unnamed protein product [Mytilus edulis]|uniref:Uncharacterized protein n=1 Tax=Mytilus edulis TaxID=6550 RepID=A0A8S3S493_MYTED|nr:unnamed protein product [Mytilus edulis]